MDHPYRIPLWRTSRELMPDNAGSRVVLSSVGTKWNDVVVEQHHFPGGELADVMFKQHVILSLLATPLLANSREKGVFSTSLRLAARSLSSRAISPFFSG